MGREPVLARNHFPTFFGSGALERPQGAVILLSPITHNGQHLARNLLRQGGNGNPVIDPRLGPLQNNGGPTQTLALLADSLASGHADDAFAPATDQRGHLRTDHFGLATDIGAYEYP